MRHLGEDAYSQMKGKSALRQQRTAMSSNYVRTSRMTRPITSTTKPYTLNQNAENCLRVLSKNESYVEMGSVAEQATKGLKRSATAAIRRVSNNQRGW